MAEEQTQVIDDEPEVEDVEPDLEPEADPEPELEPEGPSELEQAWDEVMPELAGEYNKLDPEQRERILIKRRAEQTSGKPPTEDAAAEPVPTGTEQQPEAPPVIDVPDFNVDRIKSGLAESLGETEAALVADTFAQMRDYFKSMGQLVVTTVDQAKKDIGQFGTELTQYARPQKLRALVPAISGAIEADVKSAEKILEAKEVLTEQAALELAVYRRGIVVKDASPKAKQKAAALEAAQLAGAGRRGSPAATHVPTTEKDIADIYRRDAQRKTKA